MPWKMGNNVHTLGRGYFSHSLVFFLNRIPHCKSKAKGYAIPLVPEPFKTWKYLGTLRQNMSFSKVKFNSIQKGPMKLSDNFMSSDPHPLHTTPRHVQKNYL